MQSVKDYFIDKAREKDGSIVAWNHLFFLLFHSFKLRKVNLINND